LGEINAVVCKFVE